MLQQEARNDKQCEDVEVEKEVSSGKKNKIVADCFTSVGPAVTENHQKKSVYAMELQWEKRARTITGRNGNNPEMQQMSKTRTSKVGAISKAEKAQNIFYGKNLKFLKFFFFRKVSHSAEKCERGDPFGFINIHSVAKYKKNSKGDTLRTHFRKKSRTVPKKSKGGTL